MKRNKISSRLFDVASRLKPSGKIIVIVALIVTIFILGGGIYNLIYKPPPGARWMGRYLFYRRYWLSEQTLNESLTVMIFYALGTLGMILTYQSTRYTSSPRRAYATLALGIALFILGYALTEVLYRMKTGMLF